MTPVRFDDKDSLSCKDGVQLLLQTAFYSGYRNGYAVEQCSAVAGRKQEEIRTTALAP